MNNRGTIISIYNIVLRSQIMSHCWGFRVYGDLFMTFVTHGDVVHCVYICFDRGLGFSRPWQPIHDVTQSYNPWRRDSFVSVSTRAPAKHVHGGDKYASLATNMEYYDMCGADKTTDMKW